MVATVLLTLLHVGVAVFLIMVVLLQTGKRADLAGAFGGGGSQTAFGTRGAATLLSKLTTASAVIFMLTSLSLSLLSSSRSGEGGRSVLPDEPPPAQSQPAPVQQMPTELPGVPVDQPAADDPAEPPTSDPGSGAPS
jgi:preprotein translocase subunit SecG